jgi:hypothetical protein
MTCTECEQTTREGYVVVLGDQPIMLCPDCCTRLFHLSRRQLRKYSNLSH